MATQVLARSASTKFYKRLIVCCDGTWEAGDHASKGDDSSYQTNITRMCHALADDGYQQDGTRIPQIIYYQSGVGANIPTAVGRAFAGAVGYGVNENILSAYNFLVNNYTEGDELFFFGFSRGSFTCRSLAGMISQFGILKQEESGQWFAGIWDRYQGTTKDPFWEMHKSTLAHNVKIKVMGCWDTVGSLGIPESLFTKVFNLNKKYAFHDTELSDKIENAFHALALDEHRKSFSPTLWYRPERRDADRTQTRLKQCWFAGVHTDVGRGYEDHVPGDIADITFAWMVDQCKGLLAFNEGKVKNLLEKGDFKKPPEGDTEAKAQRKTREEKAKRYGLADLHDSMDKLVFKIGGSRTRTPGQYIFKSHHIVYDRSQSRDASESSFVTNSRLVHNMTSEEKSWYWRFWDTVSGVIGGVPEDVSKLKEVYTSEVIHPSVRVRMMQDPKYNPPALQDFKLVPENQQYTWVKEWTAPNGQVRTKKLREDRFEEKSFSLQSVPAETLTFQEAASIPAKEKTGWFSLW